MITSLNLSQIFECGRQFVEFPRGRTGTESLKKASKGSDERNIGVGGSIKNLFTGSISVTAMTAGRIRRKSFEDCV